VANKTIDGLQSVPSDSNDKGVAAMLDDTNVIQYGDDDVM